MQQTLILLKPDCVHRRLVGTLIQRFECKGLRLLGLKLVQASRELVEKHYAPHKGKPFYFLLGPASVVFVANALAVAVVPVLEQKARDAGQPAPPSDFRDALRGPAGLTFLFYELGAMMLFGTLSMVLDRLRSLKKE